MPRHRAGTLNLPPVDAAPRDFSFGPEYRKELDLDYGVKKDAEPATECPGP